MTSDSPYGAWENLSTEHGAEIVAAERAMVRELRAATPATGESRAALKQSVCDYVECAVRAGVAPDVVLRLVRQLVIDALDLNTSNARDPRNESYTFVNQVAELCLRELRAKE